MRLFKIDTGYLLILTFCIEELIRSLISGNTFDIHLQDTMFVISKFYGCGLMVLYFLLMLFANRYLEKNGFRSRPFQWIILTETLLSIVVINILIQVRGHVRNSLNVSDYLSRVLSIDSIIFIFLLILVAAQLIFWGYFATAFIIRTFLGKRPS